MPSYFLFAPEFSKLSLLRLKVLKEKGKKQIIGMKKKKSIKNDSVTKITNTAKKIKFNIVFLLIFYGLQ